MGGRKGHKRKSTLKSIKSIYRQIELHESKRKDALEKGLRELADYYGKEISKLHEEARKYERRLARKRGK